ncbi:hypothetical protein HZD82_28070, partial [Pantoea agglomerans]|nr:hypothetical protein [Pantoea agglomerans]
VFGWQAKGTYNNESLSGDGKIGGMLSLRSQNTPFPIEADLGPLIGVDSGKGSEKTAQAKARRGEKSNQPADRVLPHD